MSDRVRHVDAVFGGQKVRFELSRDPVRSRVTHAMLGGYPMEVLMRFRAGQWDALGVCRVLQASANIGLYTKIEQVVYSRPAKAYALLALNVLRAYIDGIEPADALFREDTVSEEAA